MSDIPFRHNFTASLSAVLYTELDALANGGMAITAALTNTSGYPFLTIDVNLAAPAVARSSGGCIDVYLLSSVDGGTAYTYGGGGTLPPHSARLARVATPPSSDPVNSVVVNLRIPPTPYYKLVLVNKTGQALAASGSLVVASLHGVQYVV